MNQHNLVWTNLFWESMKPDKSWILRTRNHEITWTIMSMNLNMRTYSPKLNSMLKEICFWINHNQNLHILMRGIFLIQRRMTVWLEMKRILDLLMKNNLVKLLDFWSKVLSLENMKITSINQIISRINGFTILKKPKLQGTWMILQPKISY